MTKPANNPTINIEEVFRLYSICRNGDERNSENMRAWNEACALFLEKATTPEELEELLRYSAIFCGVAAGTIHAECFGKCQNKLASIYAEQIPGCTTVHQARTLASKLNKVRQAEIHITPGKCETTTAIAKACRKWYNLCTTKQELVEMMRETRNYADVYDFI